MPRPTPRRTKIVCTLGPAVSSREGVRALIGAGMDVARLNFSHGSHDDHRRMIEIVREEAAAVGRIVPVMQDLQGPKIRLGLVAEDTHISNGDSLVLTSERVKEGTAQRVHVSYDALAEEVAVGNRILLDDGNLELRVTRIDGPDVHTEVVVGGALRSRKGVNLPALKTARPSLTDKDLADLAFGLEHDVDLIALSFVRSGADVDDINRRIRAAGKAIPVIAKVEKPEAVADFDAVLEATYGVMVARGDLGIEIPMQQVPIVQKRLIRKCLEASKPVITATQMLESMMDNPRPTRAEATDVANAVLDGTDAVMLSGETAAGKYPIEAVRVMAEIVREAEANRRDLGGRQALVAVTDTDDPVTDAISYTAVTLASETRAEAICCLTHSGSTARAIASHRPAVPIYAFTDDGAALGHIALSWGVEPIEIPFQEHTDDGIRTVHQTLLDRGDYLPSTRIIITAGLPLPAMGRTNMVHVSSLGEDHL